MSQQSPNNSGEPSLLHRATLNLPTVLICLIIFFSLLPKNERLSIGSGNFNVGVIDIVSFICLVILIKKKGVFRSLPKEVMLILSYLSIATISIVFSAAPVETLKAIFKIIEAAVIFLFAYFYSAHIPPYALALAAILGAGLSMIMIDPLSGDSKIYSAGFFLVSFFFLVFSLENKKRGKKVAGLQLVSILFFTLGFILFPKKGAIVGFLISFSYLLFSGAIKVGRLKWFFALVAGLILVIQFSSSLNPGISSQLSEVALFASGEKVEDASNMYMRALLVVSTPLVLLKSEYLGFGASVTLGGLGNNLYILMTSISNSVFDFVPTSRILHPASNAFSDNLYFTLVAELGVLVLLPAFFLMQLLRRRIRNAFLFSYILFVLIFSFSSIDVGIYRGFQITFLNALLYGIVLNRSSSSVVRVPYKGL